MKTLSDAFAPPDGMVGQVAVACAYSAGQAFVGRMLDRFTGRSAASRRLEGSADLFLMLDPHDTGLAPEQLPGLVWLLPRHLARWRATVAVQHAKVALMAFGAARRGPARMWRLVVSTGNWTEASACKSIEMLWVLDVSADPRAGDDANRLDQADLAQAARFLLGLSSLYAKDDALWRTPANLLAGLAGSSAKAEDARCRFFATLDTSLAKDDPALPTGRPLFEEILRRMSDGRGQRNFVLAGSGFFEEAGSADKKPDTLQWIEEGLSGGKGRYRNIGMTGSPTRMLVVNPGTSGQVGRWAKRAGRDGWQLHVPADPEDAKRNWLHAKYLLVGQKQDRSRGRVDRGVLYVGSGNLSRAGLFSAPGRGPGPLSRPTAPGVGNIEAGVVIPLPSYLAANERALFRGLGVGPAWARETQPMQAGEDEAGRGEVTFVEPPPLTRFDVQECGTLLPCWAHADGVIGTVRILAGGNAPREIPVGSALPLSWAGHPPRFVEVIWLDHPFQIPVVTDDGRFPAQPVTLAGLDDLFAMLVSFPQSPLEDGETEDDPGSGEEEASGRTPRGHGREAAVLPDRETRRAYPLYSSMRLVEFLADRNQRLPGPEYLDDWISQVGHLLQMLPQDQVQEWQGLEVNFLDVLKRPDFAPAGQPQKWDDFVDRLAHDWKVDRFAGLTEGVLD